MTDAELLHSYVHARSDAAFTALMERYAGLVYSSALRQWSDPHIAEEITQAVFIVLSRKASTLGSKVILSAWLLTTTRLTLNNFRRQHTVRRRVEQTNAAMSTENIPASAPADQWSAIAPLLDDVLNELSETDRSAVALRFFENCSLIDIGARLGISADAAEKRVSRALEKMRHAFALRKVTVAGLLLATLLSQHAVHAAPPALAASLPAALAAAKGGVQVSAAVTTANSVIKVMAMAQTKQLAACAAIFLALGLAGGALLKQQPEKPKPELTPAAKSQPMPEVVKVTPPKIEAAPPVRTALEPAKETPPPVQVAVKPGTNLLARADVHDAVNGQWTIENGSLVSDRTSYARIEFPFVPPEEYDFRVGFAILEPRDQIVLICSHNNAQFMWKFGAHGGRLIALDNQGGELAGTTAPLPVPFEAGQSYEVVIRVRKDNVSAFFNGQRVSSLDTNYANLELNMFWQLSNENTLGVGAWGTRARFHTIDVTEVTGRGRFLRAEGQPATPKPQPQLPAEARWQDAVDLMTLIDAQRDAVAGQWTKAAAGTGVSCEANATARLEIPYKPPEEYDMKLVVSRDAGREELCVILGRENQGLHWMIGRNNLSSGFQLWEKDTDFINNPTIANTPNCLENGRKYTVILQMRKDGFHAFVDGALRSTWNNGDAFGTLKSWWMPSPGRIGIGSAHSKATFHSVQLLPITGTGEVVQANRKRRMDRQDGEQAEAPRPPEPQEKAKAQKPPAPPQTDF